MPESGVERGSDGVSGVFFCCFFSREERKKTGEEKKKTLKQAKHQNTSRRSETELSVRANRYTAGGVVIAAAVTAPDGEFEGKCTGCAVIWGI